VSYALKISDDILSDPSEWQTWSSKHLKYAKNT
jgi:hypothetical protein